jgi:Flp pilus assembly protein TadD
MDREDGADMIMGEAFDCLRAGDLDGAVALGEQLRAMRHSSCFEILGLAHAAHGDLAAAIAALEEGVRTVPSIWVLWQLLGNYYSHAGRFDDCQKAYAQALRCPGVDASSIHLNFAVALTSEERYGDALLHLAKVDSEPLLLAARAQRVVALIATERYGEAIEAAQAALALRPPETSFRYLNIHSAYADVNQQSVARLYGLLGVATWFARHDAEAALDCAWNALDVLRGQPDALWLIREIEGRVSPSACFHRLLLKGQLREAVEAFPEGARFLIAYIVAADSVEEAFELAKRLEPEELRASLSIDECEPGEKCADDPTGVYSVSGYLLFPAEDEGK